jgi:hypothetical protein
VAAVLPKTSLYESDNIKRTFARFQGSPTPVQNADGQLMLMAIQAAAQVRGDTRRRGFRSNQARPQAKRLPHARRRPSQAPHPRPDAPAEQDAGQAGGRSVRLPGFRCPSRLTSL